MGTNSEKTAQIPLSKGLFATIDESDLPLVSQYKWCAHKRSNGFAAVVNVRGKMIRMHRLIAGAKEGDLVDHCDGNPLNNTRSNLRLCTQAQNQHNRGRASHNTSGFKGVWWHKTGHKWAAEIRANTKRLKLGLFTSKEDAARAYDAAAVRLHGPFARTNFPQEV